MQNSNKIDFFTNRIMKVEYRDFEYYRGDLLKTAKNLTKSKSRFGIDWQYDIDLAQDVVQDSYIKFHKMIDKGFEFYNEDHLRQLLIKNVWRLAKTSKANNKGVIYKSKESKVDLGILPDKFHPYAKAEVMSILELESIYNAIYSLKKSIGGSSSLMKTDFDSIDEMLLYIEGYSIIEISNKTNKTVRATTTSLCRSRKKISKIFNIDKYLNEDTNN